MRNFLLGASVAYATGAIDKVAAGAVGFFYYKTGIPTVTATGDELTDKGLLVLGRTAENGGPVILPIHKNNFSFVKGEYQAGTKFNGNVTVTAPTSVGDYTLVIVKKGVQFNERNAWTANVYVTDITMSADNLAAALAKVINANSESSGVKAVASAAKITITCNKAGVDYELVPADKLYGITPNYTTRGVSAYGDAAYVKDLAIQAAADAGFRDTYRDANVDLYPAYPLNPLAQPNAADTGFTIFTLKFAEPRDMKTRDEVVNQIVQVAFPTRAAQIATFETVCKKLAGIA